MFIPLAPQHIDAIDRRKHCGSADCSTLRSIADGLDKGMERDSGPIGETDSRAPEELRRIQRALAAMPPQCRRAFVLGRVHRRSAGQIAAEMGLPVATIEAHLATALLFIGREPGAVEGKRETDAAGHFVQSLDTRSAEAVAALDQWLGDDARNAAALARIEDIWRRADALRSLPPAPDHDARPPADHPIEYHSAQQ